MGNFANVRLLLVDDNAIWRTFATKHLNEAGLTAIEVAYDGVQGVFKARALQPDIILLDVSLPHMNGIEAADEDARRRATVEGHLCQRTTTRRSFKRRWKRADSNT